MINSAHSGKKTPGTYALILNAAALYNFAFGLALAYDRTFFETFLRALGLFSQTHAFNPAYRLIPPIMAMGALYAWSARDLDRAPIALGLGVPTKVGPLLGAFYGVLNGDAPVRALLWFVVNDLLWLPLFYMVFVIWIDSLREKNGGKAGLREVLREISSNAGATSALAVLLTAALGLLGVLLSVYVIGSYGTALFVLLPFFLGVFAALIYSIENERTVGEAFGVYLTSLVWTLGFLFLFAFEGLVCIIMALPLLAVMGLAGCATGCFFQRRLASKRVRALGLIVLLNPILMQSEYMLGLDPSARTVVTRVEVKSSPASIWRKMTTTIDVRPQLRWLNRAGVTAPQVCGVRASENSKILHCTLLDGEVELVISKFIDEKLLGFRPEETPPPMKELSVYEIHAPHLAEAFEVEEGTIELIQTAEGTTLEATTRYRHRIWPPGYWSVWSSFIIDKMHAAVLHAIKEGAENGD